jgi:hypothetical protein
MDISAGWTELSSALKTLKERWEETKPQWDDPVREAFEEQFWTPLEAQVRSTLRGIERLYPVLQKMRQDCGG